jgi:hypothetical protein
MAFLVPTATESLCAGGRRLVATGERPAASVVLRACSTHLVRSASGDAHAAWNPTPIATQPAPSSVCVAPSHASSASRTRFCRLTGRMTSSAIPQGATAQRSVGSTSHASTTSSWVGTHAPFPIGKCGRDAGVRADGTHASKHARDIGGNNGGPSDSAPGDEQGPPGSPRPMRCVCADLCGVVPPPCGVRGNWSRHRGASPRGGDRQHADRTAAQTMRLRGEGGPLSPSPDALPGTPGEGTRSARADRR